MILYQGGYHGEFFIGNIVSNTDKFHYHSFECRSEELNAYKYQSIEDLGFLDQTEDDLDYYSVWYNKPIITRTHDHNRVTNLPTIRLLCNNLVYSRRAHLLNVIKGLDKSYSHIDGVPVKTFIHGFQKWPKDLIHTTNDIIYVDIKEWLHNENLEKIEDFLEIEYTQEMKDAVTQYYKLDEIMINRYFPNWKEQTDEYLMKEMERVDKSMQFLGWQARLLVVYYTYN